jgi:hypothetical protein
VWADVCRLESHVEWMADAVAIRFGTEARQGVGVRFDCDTKVGPLHLTDHMVVTEWRDGESIGIRHVGYVTGVGRFVLEPVGGERTRFTWDEELHFPRWMGGRAGAVVGGWVLSRLWRSNLRRLQSRFAS